MNMKINVGIVGYGNLGKAVEQSVLSNSNLNLIAIFSRRMIKSKFNTKIETYESFKNYSGKIEIMYLCGGSKSDLEVQTPEILELFDCINTFDTHKKIQTEFNKLDELAKISKHRLIMSCGWDPGIFSVIRGMFLAIGKTMPNTFWGKGISMGHSDAIRRVSKVIDGVQFTIPNKEAVKLAKTGNLPEGMPKHFRECFVLTDKNNETEVEYEIKNIPNYFKGEPTKVNFVESLDLLKLKNKMFHKGEIISNFKTIHGTKNKMQFSVSMDSNPNFTAYIMLAYTNAVINLKEKNKTGAFTCLDIPISYLFVGKEKDNLLNIIC